MDVTRAKYADAVHKSECKSTELLAHACGQHRAHETTLHANGARSCTPEQVRTLSCPTLSGCWWPKVAGRAVVESFK